MRYSMLLGRKNQYCENDCTTKHNLQIQCNPCQITNGIFHRTTTKNFMHCKSQSRTWLSGSHFHRKICKRIKHLQKSYFWFCVICWLPRSLIHFFAPSCAKARWQMLVGFKRSQWAVHIGWVKISGNHLLILYFFQMTLELY